MGKSNLILCGGVFFYLLLQAKMPGASPKEHTSGKSDAITENDLLTDLVSVVYPDWKKTIPKPTTTGYKKCEKQFDSLLGKGAQKNGIDLIIEAFDKRIHEDYTSCLTNMEMFVEKHLMTEKSIRLDLVRAFLEVIWEDKSIQATNLFFDCEAGLPLKDKLLQGTELKVYLPTFLLGIWHFAVVNRRDNKVGADTIEKWCKAGNEQGGNSIFKRIVGEGHCKKITINLVDDRDLKNHVSATGMVSSDDCSDQDLQIANKETDSQGNTVAGSMRRLFNHAYSDCRISDFLTYASENRINSDLLPWVDRFIKYIERDILQSYNGISSDSDAIIFQSMVRSFVNTLRDYKNDLNQYAEKKNHDWYLIQPKLPGLNEIHIQAFNPANISAIQDAASGRVTKKEISIEDSLEHNRKRLAQLYADIVNEN